MKKRELINLGIPKGEVMAMTLEAIRRMMKSNDSRLPKNAIADLITKLVSNPAEFTSDKYFGEVAASLNKVDMARGGYVQRETPALYRQWGSGFEHDAVKQMENACKLPVSHRGALMPDAHVGYGLPIGGVLAVENAVIPFAVGVDIACRMKMTVLDLPVSTIDDNPDLLKNAINKETRFGVGASFKGKRRHEVMDDESWNVSAVLSRLKDKAWSQLGTSGSGNHFVEFGTLTIEKDELGLTAGTYLALLSHSGSRGTGNEIASYYSKMAMNIHPELPKELMYLAWLSLDSELGQEYFQAMNLMGRYAAANHSLIHKHIAANLGIDVLLDIENHHNFAWIEEHDGKEFVVHRKGATPASDSTIGIIPGSMATPGYVVRGKGNPASLNSASHGAGRKMSRKKATEQFTWSDAKKILAERNVCLMSAGLDEVPMAYKNIQEVMAAQQDLVEIIARFDPRIVKMAPAGERPED